LALFANVILGIVGFLVVFDLFLGYPLYLEERRISQVEKHFPNAIREIAYLLKSGGTYEYAIRELTSYDYGPLNVELENVLLRLEQGYNFEESLSIIGENVDSQLIRKTIAIIIDSIKAGASLADILEDLAEDMRKLYKLDLDRKAKTTLQVLFIFVAGSLIAPAIYGLVLTIIDFLLSVTISSGLSEASVIASAQSVRATIEAIITAFVFVQSFASSFMVVVMRERKYSKIYLYLPLFLLCAYIAFYAMKFISKYLLIGMM
jgi:flagellar protein FlaJ